MAGKFLRAIGEIYDDLGRRTLSRKPIWHLFSGEKLELWLLNNSRLLPRGRTDQGRKKIRDVQTITPNLNTTARRDWREWLAVNKCRELRTSLQPFMPAGARWVQEHRGRRASRRRPVGRTLRRLTERPLQK